MSLKDELLKAGLVNKKKIKKIEHEQRVQRKQEGQDKIQEQQQQQEQKIEQQIEAQRVKDQELARQQNEKRQEKEQQARLKDIMSKAKIYEAKGRRRFYFIAKNNHIPCLNISDPVAEKLEKGRLAIVECDWGRDGVYIVERDIADRLSKLDSDAIRFLNR